jgi:hypothetical protein
MITKKQFCKSIVEDYESKSGRKVQNSDILQSSSLAVAMEYLDMLTEEWAWEYASERGGNVWSYYDKENGEYGILSARELLELLPR